MDIVYSTVIVVKQINLRALPSRKGGVRRGFALVTTLTIMALLSVVMLGVLSLSNITVRSASIVRYDLEARANARLALALALGELQKHLGPDQRVSAPASILDASPESASVDGVRHPHWVGVWSHLDDKGASIWIRDDAHGGLLDRRDLEGWKRESESISYLVSGNEGGRQHAKDFREADTKTDLVNPVTLVGEGSLGDDPVRLRAGQVEVERVVVNTGARGGHYAYWVGDLGIRANIATRNAHANSADPGLAMQYALMSSQEAEAKLMTGNGALAQDVSEEEKGGLLTAGQVDFVGNDSGNWRKAHFHDFTVYSRSVLADVKNGGLKRDLTAYFQSNGVIAGLGTEWTQGITDQDNIIGPANPEAAQFRNLDWEETRHRFTSPRFGLLRRWAQLGRAVPHGDAGVSAIAPKSEPNPRGVELEGMASANLNPASIAALDQPNMMPILVEGSMYSVVSWHRNPPQGRYPFNIRLHSYPRVVLWNPYSVELEVDDLMVLLHVNGRKEMHTEGVLVDPATGLPRGTVRNQWIWFFGGRSKHLLPGQDIRDSNLYRDPYIGSLYFGIENTTFGPGECLVFSPDRADEYNHRALESNILSPSYAPDPDRNYYHTSSVLRGGMDFYPTTYWFAPTNYWDIKNQSDDFRMILKDRGTEGRITPEKFDRLPQVSFVSCSMQFGAGREPRLAWNEQNREVMYETALSSARWLPRPGQPAKPIPNVRTRDGYRLRWFQEHQSNIINAGALSNEPHFDTAPLANWNPRASYSFRTPWDNLGGQVAPTGSGPWFFGSYTRDLFDQAVSWDDMMPIPRGGRFHGNPFGQPVEGQPRNVLFDVPRQGSGVMSIGQLQHAKLSEFSWHPTYAVGQSIVDPRVGTRSSAPVFEDESEGALGGWNSNHIGWSSDAERSAGREEWARFGRALAQNYAESDHLVYDLAYEANHGLWDSFFLSTGTESQKAAFVDDPYHNPLPNGRLVLASSTRDRAGAHELADFHRAAYHLLMDGGFNVNSTSIEAWKAFLAATRDSGLGSADQTPFPRVIDSPDGESPTGRADVPAAWAGFRSLSDGELGLLAAEIVREVKTRGPFLSLADFVNRRLLTDSGDPSGRRGPLQAAIDAAGLNSDFERAYPLDNAQPLSDYVHPDNVVDPTRLEQVLKPSSKAWGAAGYLTQGDLLQVLGSGLTARSDTFVIRSYGDAVDDQGEIQARAFCEAVVQRTPVAIKPSKIGLNPADPGERNEFGRRFTIHSFRWLTPDEI